MPFVERFKRGANEAHDSFWARSKTPVARIYKRFILAEQRLAQTALTRYAEGVDLTPRLAAVVEAATLNYHNPVLARVTPAFMPLYRFLREAELSNGAELRHPSMGFLIGSGTTMPEVLALHLPSPSPAEIASVVASRDRLAFYENSENLWSKARSGNLQPVMVDLGHKAIVAIDPDESQITGGFEHAERFFRIKEGKEEEGLARAVMTIGTFMMNTAAKSSFDMILLHRADPRVFRTDYGLDEELLTHLVEYLCPSGKLVITVGQGNTRDEFLDRTNTLIYLRQRLIQLGLTEVPVFPCGLLFSDLSEAYLQPNFGIYGAFIGAKPS